MHQREETFLYQTNTKMSIWGPLAQKLLSQQCLRKRWTMVGLDLDRTNERTNEGALPAKRNTNSPAKHPVDYKRVNRRIKWSVSTPVYFEKESKSKSSNNSTRTGPEAVQVPVKMRLQPTSTLQDNQPVFGIH